MKEALEKIYSSKSKTFLAFCSFFILGSSFASFFEFPVYAATFLYAIEIGLLSLLAIFWNNRAARFLFFCLLFFVFGIWRLTITLPNCSHQSEICHYNGERSIFMGIVDSEPDEKDGDVSYIVKAKDLKGKVLLKTKRFPTYSYGDELKLACDLEKPTNDSLGTFKYDKYLARNGVWSICRRPVVSKIGEGKNNMVLEKIFEFKSGLTYRLRLLWAEPEASFMAGLLYGSKSGLPKQILNDFSSTGVSHVVAVSGFNITIIVVTLMSILVYLGLFRQHAFYVVVFITSLFVVFTGLSASAVRAGIMGLLVLFAKQLGRGSRVENLLVLTIALMQLANPFFLFWDVGFQLSFLATLGLVYLSPVISKILKFPEKMVFLKEPLVSTLSAIIITLPLILYEFGSLSLVAPITNILILWVIPWIMLFGAVSVALSYIFFPLGQLIAFIAHLGLSYVIMVVRFFGRMPYAKLNIRITVLLMVFAYLGIIYFILRSKTCESQNTDI